MIIGLCAVGGFILGVRGAPEKARLPGKARWRGPGRPASGHRRQALDDAALAPPPPVVVEKVEEKKPEAKKPAADPRPGRRPDTAGRRRQRDAARRPRPRPRPRRPPTTALATCWTASPRRMIRRTRFSGPPPRRRGGNSQPSALNAFGFTPWAAKWASMRAQASAAALAS
uniref:Uncharacterized protein n=1 Tax=Phenylobacterium glaciei TaxID=2803784 RepID=A0A974P502_9CAUL|nr:hypothetical protein JKL49_02570 [Phenylobacterium glaciei]